LNLKENRMTNPFREMSCFLLAGGKRNRTEDFLPEGELTRLESGYRRYAAVFEKVTLVLKEDQAKERYLNYPHVCDEKPGWSAMYGIEAALRSSESDTVFIGSSEITDFPLELLVMLVRNYRGESFLGFSAPGSDRSCQPLFGIYNKKLVEKLEASIDHDAAELYRLLAAEGRLIPLPDGASPEQLGLR
jgi:molybdopterin-guanine dinucleotide biosynthesis protein A